MTIQLIETQVRNYLAKVARGEKSPLSTEIIEEYKAACERSLRRQLEEKRDGFRIRMSNIGKPLCQLQLEAKGIKGLSPPYNAIMNGMFGDNIEAMTIAILQAAGVTIQSKFERVSLEIGGINMKGELDVIIDDVVYDIKSSSDFSFDKKFSENTREFYENDAFGYLTQGVLYAKAKGKPFGGWIVTNKDNGEIKGVPATVDTELRNIILFNIENKIDTLRNNAIFRKCFTDREEKFRKVPTGNRILEIACAYCSFKKECWPQVEYKSSLVSESKTPKWFWYTHTDERFKHGNEV